MATRQNDELEPSKIIGAISKLAGAFVGTAVVTGTRVIRAVTLATGGSSVEPGEKPMQVPAKRKKKKKATRKTEIKGQKAKKKKKAAKRKGTSSPRRSGTSKKKPAQALSKKKKMATRKTETKGLKTEVMEKGKGTSGPQNRPISKPDVGTNVTIEAQEPQPPIAKAEVANEKSGSAIASPEAGTEKNGTTGAQKPSVRIIEYGNKAEKAVVATASVL